MPMVKVFFLSLFRFVVRGFFERLPCLLAMGLGLLLSQGCAMLQRPSDITAPTETTAQPVVQPAQHAVEPAQPMPKKSPAAQVKLPQTGEASW